MKTAMLMPQQNIVNDEWELAHCKDDRGNNTTWLVSKETIEKDGVQYQASTGTEYGAFDSVDAFLKRYPGQMIFIHGVRMEHLGEMVQWAAETFYAQNVEVSL